MKRWTCLCLLTLALPVFAAGVPDSVKSGPANTWVEVVKGDATDGRFAPIFYVEPASLRIFRASGGSPSHEDPLLYKHYDTEELDLANAKWINVYPTGNEAGRPVSGTLPKFQLELARFAGGFERRGR